MVQKKLPVIVYSLNKIRGWVHSSPTDGAQGTLPDIRNKRLPSVLADFGSNTSTLLLPLGTIFFLNMPIEFILHIQTHWKGNKNWVCLAFETYCHGLCCKIFNNSRKLLSLLDTCFHTQTIVTHYASNVDSAIHFIL